MLRHEITYIGDENMTAKTHIQAINIENWVANNRWPTEVSDTNEMIDIYREWVEIYPRCRITGMPNGDYLVKRIIDRMIHIHPESQEDALVISTLLIIKARFLAINDGINVNQNSH